MDERILWGAIVIVLLIVILGGMALSWRGRRRRDEAAWPASPAPAELSSVEETLAGGFVAITLAEQPLQRITAAGLGFRGPARLHRHAEGLVLDVDGAAPFFVPAARLRGVGRGSWVIDRVVEPDGLIVIAFDWADAPVDLYFKPTSVNEGTAALAGLRTLIPATLAVATPDEGAQQ